MGPSEKRLIEGGGTNRTQGDAPTDAPTTAYPDEILSPTTDSRLESLMSHEHFPLAIGAAEVLFGTLFDWFTTSPEEELLDESLDWAELQRLRASGVFSEADLQNVIRGNKPVTDLIAGNLASRGVEGGAGAAVLAQAQAAPFHQLQAQAAQLYQTSLVQASQFVAQVAQNDALFSRSFGSITRLYETMRAEDKENPQPPADPMFAEFNTLTRRFAELLKDMER